MTDLTISACAAAFVYIDINVEIIILSGDSGCIHTAGLLAQ